ncbi:MAG TPA: response regulator [Thermoanaerobaculia bacterium]|nr:response regulator [Thermoanaerobaculia bacterium]
MSATILAVDDNPDNLLLLSGILQRAGYEVRAANSGARALKMLEREAPDLVLLDINMPEMDGYEVCRAIKANAALAPVPVVFISALDDVVDKVRGFEAGAVDYVTKPFQEAEVLARVDTQLRVHRLQRELEKRNRELLAVNERLLSERQRTAEMFSAVSELLPGHVLDDVFRIDMKIGEGGFGVVYRGMDLRLGRPVAIKVLHPIGDPNRVKRFETEGIAASRVRHMNAVEIFAAGHAQGISYLVMELLRGYSLRWLMQEHGRIEASRAASIAVQICDALTAAHAARVIHRDITPANVFLHRTPDGEIVKVLDFGIARLVDEATPRGEGLTAIGQVIGTPEYMSPERLLGGTYDASADVYAVGVLLYRMLSGGRLFETQSSLDIAESVRLHLTSAPRSLGEVAPDVPAALADLAMRMLAKDPTLRPTSREAAEELRAWSQSQQE